MTLALSDLLVVLLLGLLVSWFLSSIRVRELAIEAVKQASRRDDFQLLDQSVQLYRVSLSRDSRGYWRIWRQYRFDYSLEGVERREGCVIMLGNRLQALVVQESGATLH